MTAPTDLCTQVRGLASADPALARWLDVCGIDPASSGLCPERELATMIDAVYLYGERDAAVELVERWRTLRPSSPLARYSAALFDRYELAPAACWREGFHAGFAAGLRERTFDPGLPRWHGPPERPRRLLVYGDQGIGDQIRRLSYLHDIAELWPDLRLLVHAKLLGLARHNFPQLDIEPITGVDAAASGVFSHALALGDLEALYWDARQRPLRDSFLRPDPLLRRTWSERLAVELRGGGLRVGICYRSSLVAGARAVHYSAIEQWLPILRLAGIDVVSLQYGVDDAELASVEQLVGRRIHRWPDFDPFKDVDTLAAVIANLDLVVATTTMVADLAAALGVETWRLQVGAGARSERSAVNPWYGARTQMFYRSAQASWESVLSQVARRLGQRRPDAALGDPSAGAAWSANPDKVQ